MILAALLSTALAGEPPSLAQIQQDIDQLVLSGRPIPPDFLLQLSELPKSGDRMLVLVYLRRAGLLTGATVPLDRYVFDSPAYAPVQPGVDNSSPDHEVAP